MIPSRVWPWAQMLVMHVSIGKTKFYLYFCSPCSTRQYCLNWVTILVMQAKALSKFVCRDLWDIALEQSNIVELDSSTDVKFSKHLIVKIPGHAFEDNSAVGSFVHQLLGMPEVSLQNRHCYTISHDEIRKPDALPFVSCKGKHKKFSKLIWFVHQWCWDQGQNSLFLLNRKNDGNIPISICETPLIQIAQDRESRLVEYQIDWVNNKCGLPNIVSMSNV